MSVRHCGRVHSPPRPCARGPQVLKRLKELDLPRYKFMVQCVVGEQRGEGVRIGCRTLWDNDTDCYASATFISDEIFASATAYAMYLY